MDSGQEVLHWMNHAYEAAEQGNPEKTFYCWEQAWKKAGPNEKRYLDTVERRTLMNQAYEKSARNSLYHAGGIRAQELFESSKPASFSLHEQRRNKHVHEWTTSMERAYEHALECNHHTLRMCILEERTKRPLKQFWRTRLKQLFY